MFVNCMKIVRLVGLFAFIVLIVSACGIEGTDPVFSESSKEVQPSATPLGADEIENNILTIAFYPAAAVSWGYYYVISEDNILHCYMAEWNLPNEDGDWRYYAHDPDKFLESVETEEQTLLNMKQLEKISSMADEISCTKKQNRIPGDDSLGVSLFYRGKTYEDDYYEDKMLHRLIDYVLELSQLEEESDTDFWNAVEK